MSENPFMPHNSSAVSGHIHRTQSNEANLKAYLTGRFIDGTTDESALTVLRRMSPKGKPRN